MKFKSLLFILIIIVASFANAQNQVQIEDEDNLYWQSDVEVRFSHFQSEIDSNCISLTEKLDLNMSASIQLVGIVDIPKSHLSRKIKKRKGDDKLYLSPAFCKKCSCARVEDSMELVFNQLLFDVPEMCARFLRKELAEIKEERKINNVNAMFYTTLKNKWDERMRGTWASIYQDVLIQKKDSAYVEWRALVDEMLEENKDFATQPYEIERLILGEPVEDGYVQAKTIMGDLKNTDENE
jgi:hypothetical protein